MMFALKQVRGLSTFMNKFECLTRSQIAITVGFLMWIFGASIAFWLQRTQLFFGLDGSYMLDLAIRQIEWHVPLTTVAMDWLQGLGDIFSSFNARLIPGFYFSQWLSGSNLSKALSYTWWLAELSLAIYLFARTIGARPAVATLAAVTTCLLMFPFSGLGLVYTVLALVPQLSTEIACALVMASALVCLGRGGIKDVLWGMAFIAGLTWFLFAAPLAFILAAPFVSLSGITSLLASRDRERRRKFIFIVACGSVFLVAGPAGFIAGMLFNTAATFFPIELQNDRGTFVYASIFFHWFQVGPAGPILVITAIGGALLAIFQNQQRIMFWFATTLLTYLFTRLSFATLTILFDFWRGPSPLYFEFYIIPLYAIFSASLVLEAFGYLLRSLGISGRIQIDSRLIICSLAGGLAIALHFTKDALPNAFVFPPQETPLIHYLTDNIAQAPGTTFKGRVFNAVGQKLGNGITWMNLHTLDNQIGSEFHNDYRIPGLHYFGIPGLFEYGSTITPEFYALTTRLLAYPDDRQIRSVSVLRKIDTRILTMLGVRYILTDSLQEGMVLRQQIASPTQTLFLYEISAPNIGNYSPLVSVSYDTAAGILARLKDPQFDPKQEAILSSENSITGLVPAQSPELVFEGDGLRIRAHSSRTSLLVLPVEFSRCLNIQTATEARLMRANLLETAVIFHGDLDARITMKFGPFTNPYCRLMDRSDGEALQF